MECLECLECPRLPDFSGQEDSPDCPKFRVSKRDSLRLSPDALWAPGVVLTASVRGLSIVSRGAGGVTELQAWTEFHSLIVKASSEQRPPRWFMFQVPQNVDSPAVVRSRNSVQPAQGAHLWWALCSLPTLISPSAPLSCLPVASPPTLRSWACLACGLQWCWVWLRLFMNSQTKPMQANNWLPSSWHSVPGRRWQSSPRSPESHQLLTVTSWGPLLGRGGLPWVMGVQDCSGPGGLSWSRKAASLRRSQWLGTNVTSTGSKREADPVFVTYSRCFDLWTRECSSAWLAFSLLSYSLSV